MRTVSVPFLAAVLALVVVMPRPALGDDALRSLKCIRIVVETLTTGGKAIGLEEKALEQELFVAAKAKLPRLSHGKDCSDHLYLNINAARAETTGGRGIGYSASIGLTVGRPAMLVATGQISLVFVWREAVLQGGALDEARADIRETIGTLVTSFAAAYYKAGNP